jgi:hypothetical protein
MVLEGELKRLRRVVEDMKVSAAPVTVRLVSGGSIVYMDELEGVMRCIMPPHHDSANAVGAAIAKVAGEVDAIEILDGRDEMAVVKEVGEAAVAAAILKGADPGDVRIVRVDKIPLQYVTNKATRISVKAIGKFGKLRSLVVISLEETSMPAVPSIPESDVDETGEGEKRPVDGNSHKTATKPSLEIDIAAYRPDIRNEIWPLSEVDLEFIACGTGILGTGGGGPSYLAYLVSLDALRTGRKDKMRVISPNYLKDDDLVCFGS